MGSTISVRLDLELAQWLRATAAKSGVTQGRIIRDQLEKARKREQAAFMRLAGSVDGPAACRSAKVSLERLAELAEKYADRHPDLADLCLIRMSELHPKLPVITTDRKDFGVYRRGGMRSSH